MSLLNFVLQSQKSVVKIAQLKCFLEDKGPLMIPTLLYRQCPKYVWQ